MTWFFAILIVLALGGIAAVASGRGAPMSEAMPDRADVTVPAEGPVTADDVRRVRFTLAFRGYRMSEVDGLLDRLARQLEEQRSDTAPETSARTSAETSPQAGTRAGAEGPADRGRGDHPSP